jgi:hypothetical protein
MATASVRDRQQLPVITNAAAPTVDLDEVSGIIAILDTALDAYRKLKKYAAALGAGAVIADRIVALFAERLPHAEYAVSLWASANHLEVARIVADHGDRTMQVWRVHDGDPSLGVIATLQWPFEPKLTAPAIRNALRAPHWSDDATLTDEERADPERMEAGHA